MKLEPTIQSEVSDKENTNTVLGSKITADGDCSHENEYALISSNEVDETGAYYSE